MTGELVRRERLRSRRVLAVVIAALVLAGTGAAIRDRGDDASDRVVVATAPTERLYLLPSDLDAGLELAYRTVDEPGIAREPALLRLFARQDATGVVPKASLAVLVAKGSPNDLRPRSVELSHTPAPAPRSPETIAVGSQRMEVLRETPDRSSVSFVGADGKAVAVVADHLSDDELGAAADSLRTGDATTKRPALPAGFAAMHTGPWPADARAQSALRQDWRDDRRGQSFTLTIYDGDERSLASLAWDANLQGVSSITVRGHRGILTGIGVLPTVAWMERPDTLVSIAGNGLDGAAVAHIAERLRPVDKAAWLEEPMMAARPGGLLGLPVASGVHGGIPWQATAGLMPSLLGIPAATCLHVTAILSTCSPPANQLPIISSVDVRPRRDGRAAFLTAALDRRVAKVTVTSGDGTTADSKPIGTATDLPAIFLLVGLAPDQHPMRLTAFDAEGREMARVDIPEPPQGGYATPAP